MEVWISLFLGLRALHGACAEEKIPAFKFVRDILYLEYHAGVFPNETHCKHSETDLILISLFSQPKVGETKNLKRKRWHTHFRLEEEEKLLSCAA